jgi:hypothetical protein
MKTNEEYSRDAQRRIPELKGRIFFTNHAADRFNSRFSGEIPEDIVAAIKVANRKKKRTGLSKIKVSRNKSSIVVAGKNKNIVITGWKNEL